MSIRRRGASINSVARSWVGEGEEQLLAVYPGLEYQTERSKQLLTVSRSGVAEGEEQLLTVYDVYPGLE